MRSLSLPASGSSTPTGLAAAASLDPSLKRLPFTPASLLGTSPSTMFASADNGVEAKLFREAICQNVNHVKL
eukprot:m.117372 g.117372  ORF g.117372 m.117372 type:complete len:72 (-) comp15545_c0_seq4:126-341(-)